MCTPESSLTPKNYITSGISRSLLTPCRQVGLSRSKKTPKNNSPQISASHEGITTTPVSLKNPPIDLAESEQTPSIAVGKIKVHTDLSLNRKSSKKKKYHNALVHIENAPNSMDKTILHQQVGTTAVMSNKSALDTVSPNIAPPEINQVEREVKICLTKYNDDEDEQSEEKNMTKIPCEPNSPSSSITQTVIAQVHHPIVKRVLNFSQHQDMAVKSVKDSSSSESNVLSVKNSEENLAKSLKRKFRLCSDDFDSELKTKESNFNQSVPHGTTSLARFNTDDYLSEYSKSPTTFQKHLKVPNDDDFMPSEKVKFKTIKSTESSEKKDGKNYVALFYSSITKSQAENSMEQVSKTHGKVESNKMLTVSLERFPNIVSSCILKQNTNSKNTFENDSDDEFTSSPHSDKKRRENLLQLISQIKKEVKRNKEILERLKQAQVYKKIHDPKKVNEFSERWMEVCEISLRDLLTKMRQFGPTEMDGLLTKLKIPDHVIVKLKL